MAFCQKYFLLFFSCIGFISFSQETKSINTLQLDISSNNVVEKVSQQVKHYSKEPVYQVYVKNSLCLYEVLVNDFPVAKMFEYGQMMTPYDINSEILKSGKQKITLRLYPAPEEFNQSGDILSPNTKCNLEIEYVDNKDPKYEYIPVMKFELPTKVRMAGRNNDMAIPEFEGEGKKYYEITYEFDATVPYENEGWNKGQDLTKLDQKLLQKKTLEFYTYYKNNYTNKQYDIIAQNEYKLMCRDAISQYQDKDKISKIWKERTDMINIQKNWLPLDYKIKFYGDGKIVSLLQKSQDDIRLIGESALAFTYNKNNSTQGRFIGVYLYLPKDKKLEDGLEIIQ